MLKIDAGACMTFFIRLTALAVLSVAFGSASAQDRQRNQPGQFDFYVLALSWSPSFCEATAERGRQAREQCGARPFSFVVHGLWPQFEKGFPQACQVPAPRLSRNIMSAMLDLMPSPRLIYHEWDNHGTCSGLSQSDYFETIRKARGQIKIPAEYLEVKSHLTVMPGEVEAAFIKANQGLKGTGIAVTCDSRRLGEVRICLGKDLSFRDCPEIDRRACKRDKVVMPPVRGG